MTKKIYIGIFLYFYCLLATFVALWLHLNYLQNIFLYFGPPVLLLLLHLGKYGKKLRYESFVVGVPAVFLIDYLAHTSKAWYENSSFVVRVLNVFPIETFFWSVLYVGMVILVYENLFDKFPQIVINKHFKILYRLLIIMLVFFFNIYFWNEQLLRIQGFYLYMLLIFFLINIVGLFVHPHLIKQVLLCTLFLFIPLIIYELTSLYLGHWYFEVGNHLFYFSAFGLVLPIEEILWFPLTTGAIIICHEVFADNGE